MKLALWLATAIALAGCSVSHRSGDFACDKQSDCAAGRSCIEGFCVLPADSGVPDTPHSDAAVCPSVCTSCNLDQRSCTIDCALNGGCKQQVNCPLGFSCDVQCSRDSACSNGVSCAGSTSCKVTCSGTQSCRNVSCGLGACAISCTGSASCDGLTCGSSCACDVTCNGIALCRNLSCKPGCAVGGRCTSLPLGCNTCR
jgi:hypothetical protein